MAFSVDPYLVSALTLDKEHLQKNLERLEVGLTHQTGTNIGSALAEGINRLRNLKSKSKILILLTDGKDEPAPLTVLSSMQMVRNRTGSRFTQSR